MSNKKDFATSTVLTAPSPADSGTSLVVQSGHGARFPSTPFYVTVHPPSEFPTLDNAEKLLVSSKSTDTFTIARAQGDTTAKSIEAGWRISNAVFLADFPATFDDLTDGSTNKAFTSTLKTKLDGIETAADVTDAGNVGSSIHGASAKTTPVDADTVALIDSAASNVLKKLSWSNIKATLKTYFDTLYNPLVTPNTSRAYGYRTSNQTTTSSAGIQLATNAPSANLSVTHTANTGRVRVHASLPCQNSANNAQVYIRVDGSTDYELINYAGGLYTRTGELFITGLSVASHTFDLRAKIDGGATFTFPAYSTATLTVQDY